MCASLGALRRANGQPTACSCTRASRRSAAWRRRLEPPRISTNDTCHYPHLTRRGGPAPDRWTTVRAGLSVAVRAGYRARGGSYAGWGAVQRDRERQAGASGAGKPEGQQARAGRVEVVDPADVTLWDVAHFRELSSRASCRLRVHRASCGHRIVKLQRADRRSRLTRPRRWRARGQGRQHRPTVRAFHLGRHPVHLPGLSEAFRHLQRRGRARRPRGGNRTVGSDRTDYWVWDGAQWLVNAQRAGIPTGSQPVAGSIIVFGTPNAANWGHVAYVEQVSSPTSIAVDECNYDWQGSCRYNHWENPQAQGEPLQATSTADPPETPSAAPAQPTVEAPFLLAPDLPRSSTAAGTT